MTQTAPVPPKEKAAKKTGEYIVLLRTGTASAPSEPQTSTKEVWQRVGSFTGSAASAIKQAANEKDGVYVAIPARSFQPRTHKTETVKKVSLT